jgi:hypothetical protein
MGLPLLRLGDRTLPHRCGRTLLYITAKLIVEWQRWVDVVEKVGDERVEALYLAH